MLRDIRGVAVATDDPRALAAYERAVEQMHAYEGDPLGVIDAALAQDPSFVLGHCLKAALVLGAVERRLEPLLQETVETGERYASHAGARERAHLAAARAWLEGDLEGAHDRYGRIAVEWPRDTLAIQTAHLCDFYLGDQVMLRDRLAQVLHAWDEQVPGYGWLLGMHAFGLEETGDHRRAEAAGARAVELQPRDAWASHAVAHVMEMEGRADEGSAWIEATSRAWSPDNTFAFHNHWHHALYRLDLGDVAGALALYDERVRPRRSEAVLEMTDASALLWRLQLRGVDVRARFAELADDWRPRLDDRYYAFNDAHAVMAFVGAGRDADARALLAAVEASAAGGGTNARMAREVGLPVCRALVAFGRGDFDACVEALLPVRPRAVRFGGSNAQRDVLSLTLLEAALRGGRLSLARALASERTRLRPANPYGWRATARVLEASGEPARAAAARQQALRLAAPPRGTADAAAVAARR